MKKFLLLFLVTVISTSSYAASITVNMSDRGWYSGNGLHTDINQNTITGPGYRNDTNSWFLFDFTSLSNSFSSATLRLELEMWNGSSSSGHSSIWDYNSSLSALSRSHLTGSPEGISINSDLESGNMYATQIVSSSDVGSIVEFTLSSSALLDINAAVGGLFALGTHLDGVSANNWLRWSGWNETRTHQLVLETGSESVAIPEPTISWLLISGLFGFAGISRKAS